MSDLFKGITFPWQEVTPADDAIVRKAILPDRRLTGCDLSYSGYTLTMTAGVLIVCGRQFRHTAVQNWAVTGAASGYARLLLTIDVTKASTEDAFEQITASIEYATAADGFPDLRQDDINNAGTIYQTSICVVALGPGGITGFTGQILPGDNVFYPGRPVSMGGHRVKNVAAPEADGDAVNLGYVNQNYRHSDWMPSASDIKKGILPIERGGTDANTKAGILTNLFDTFGITDFILTTSTGYENSGYCTPEQLRNAMGARPSVYTYPSLNGGDLNGFTEETHLFVFNVLNSPSSIPYGFFDVYCFSGGGFSPSNAKTVILQRMTAWDRTLFAYRRSTDGGASWSEWDYVYSSGTGYPKFRTYDFDNCSSPLLTLQNNYASLDNGVCLIYCKYGGSYCALLGYKIDNYAAFIEVSYGTGSFYKYRNQNGIWSEDKLV